MQKPFGREGDDLRTLALAAVLLPLTWWLLLGWSWPRTLGGHDELALAQNLLAIREMVRSGEGWSSLVYRPDLLGGFKGRDVVGPFPLFPLLAHMGLSPSGISVVAAFVVQWMLGFLASRTAEDVVAVWSNTARGLSLLERTAVLWLAAFAPALGWRVGHGHLNLLAGLLPFAAGLALLAAAAAGRLTATLGVVAAASFVLGLLHSGQQIVLYGLVFGAPVLLGVWLSLGGEWRRLGVPVAIAAGALLIALPALWPMVAYARSSDAPRGFGDAVVTYDVVTSNAGDWITSLFWSVDAVPATRDASLRHEVNYPAGPLLVLLAVVPWRRARALAIGLAVSLGALLAFSMDIAPLSRALLLLVPPLKSFRVPARAMLPWLWMLPILATAALLSRDAPPQREAGVSAGGEGRRKKKGDKPGPDRWRAIAMALIAAAALFLAPSRAREVVVWALAAVAVSLVLRQRPGLPAAAVLVVLGVSSVAAFRERLLPFEDGNKRLAEASKIGDALRRAKPELESALSRVQLDLEIPAFTVNTAFAAGLSSLDGYAIPTRRFAALVFALRDVRYEPTAIFFKLRPDEPAFGVLRQLYNVLWLVALPTRGSLAVNPAEPASGAAWFSLTVSRVPDTVSLARELLASGDGLHARVAEVLWVVESDPLATPAPLSTGVDAACAGARLVRVDAPLGANRLIAHVDTAGTNCPLTFASNFTEDLRAEAVLQDGRHLSAPVFPAYGALAGVVVPAGTREVHLRAEPPRLPWAGAWLALGIALCVGAVLCHRRRCTLLQRIIVPFSLCLFSLGAAQADDEAEEVKTFEGTLKTGIFAVGGETTGTVLRTEKDGVYELDLGKNKERQALAEKLNGKKVVVEGVYKPRPGVEVKERRIIEVRTLRAR